MKKISFIKRGKDKHWVGDGFHVRGVFNYNDIAQEMSPFLLLDYAEPENFPPTERRLGVGEHPHRGFETVTIVYEGEVEHRDSTGAGGKIGPGDVQWMTAGAGLVHEEFHGREYAKRGGPFEMVQLWVNLPKKDKMTKPGYQGITADTIPTAELADGRGQVRVIAGQYNDARGPARTFSPMDVWDVRLKKGAAFEASAKSGWTAAFLVLDGAVKVGAQVVEKSDLAVFEREGSGFMIEATEDAKILFLAGEPLNEPIVGYGPFVMNTEGEIRQALADYRSGKMGHLAQSPGDR
ncbi:MAG: pirin family protein [Bacteriovoracia bacterium]